MAKGFWKRTFGSGNKQEEYYEEMDNEGYDSQGDAGAEEQYYSEESELDYEEPSFSSRRSKVINMPDQSSRAFYAPGDASSMQMIIFKPSSYDETQGVIDSLRAKKPVIVNLDELEVGVAQRILDFISGAVYALNGDIRKAARNIFVVAPANVEVSSNMDSGARFDDYSDEEY